MTKDSDFAQIQVQDPTERKEASVDMDQNLPYNHDLTKCVGSLASTLRKTAAAAAGQALAKSVEEPSSPCCSTPPKTPQASPHKGSRPTTIRSTRRIPRTTPRSTPRSTPRTTRTPRTPRTTGCRIAQQGCSLRLYSPPVHRKHSPASPGQIYEKRVLCI